MQASLSPSTDPLLQGAGEPARVGDGELHSRMLAAHGRRDHVALVALYAEAADGAISPQAAGFYLTHAYVFALETGHPDTALLHARLVAQGREE